MNVDDEMSLSSVLQHMTEWKHTRYGLSSPKPFKTKIEKAFQIVLKNKLSFTILLLGYFIAGIVGNSVVLLIQWAIDANAPKSGFQILVILTASWPLTIWRSLLNICVMHVLISAMKRKGHKIFLSDLTGTLRILSIKLVLATIASDSILASPMEIAQTLFPTSFVWAIIYLVFGFLLNWVFSMAQILVYEDQSIPFLSSFIWSAAAALSPSSFASVAVANLAIFFGAPLIISTPFVMVLQFITFFEIFGYASAEEVHFSTQDD